MNDKDKADIAAIFEDILAQHAPACPHGIDAETAASLKQFAEAVRIGKKTIYKTIVGAIATALIGAFVLGLVELFKKGTTP